jgi:hypothetical protein
MFLSVRHCNFVFWSMGHRAMSIGQIYFKFFFYWTLCGVL